VAKDYKALGLMSGTSLDGVDVALIETDGERVLGFGPTLEMPFVEDVKAELREATEVALRWGFAGAMPNSLARASQILDATHVEAVKAFVEMHGAEFEVIGYHGQTVAHDARIGRTLQLGSGQALADAFKVTCVSDFRSGDVTAGGQGAPLAPVYHAALVEGMEDGVAVLNLGGVGNVSVFAPELMASDTGPGNGPLDAWMVAHEGVDFDKDGAAVMRGVPDFSLVDHWLGGDFFQRDLPRSADRYDFAVRGGDPASLAAFAVAGVRRTLEEMGHATTKVIVCGGGRRNRGLMAMLREELRCEVVAAEAVGWDGDALEAQAFAFLAVRRLLGLPISFPKTTGVPEPMTGGMIATPRA